MLFTMRKTVQVTHELNRHNPIPYPLYTHSQNFPKSLTLPQEFFHKRSFTLALLISLTQAHGRAKCSHHLFLDAFLLSSVSLFSQMLSFYAFLNPSLLPQNMALKKATKHGFEKATKQGANQATKQGNIILIMIFPHQYCFVS